MALTPTCIFLGIWVVWMRQGTGGGGGVEGWFPSGERWESLRRAGQSLLVLLSSLIMLVHPLTMLSSVQAGHSFFVSLTMFLGSNFKKCRMLTAATTAHKVFAVSPIAERMLSILKKWGWWYLKWDIQNQGKLLTLHVLCWVCRLW